MRNESFDASIFFFFLIGVINLIFLRSTRIEADCIFFLLYPFTSCSIVLLAPIILLTSPQILGPLFGTLTHRLPLEQDVL